MVFIINKENYGILECLLASFYYFIPFLIFYFLKVNVIAYLAYGYIIIFILMSTLAHIRFKK